MLDIKFVRSNPDAVKTAVRLKGVDLDVDEILALDSRLRELTAAVEGRRKERKDMARAFAGAGEAEKPRLAERSRALADEIAAGEAELQALEERLRGLMLITPSIPDEDVPVGPDASANVVVRRVGTPPAFDFEPLDHVDLLKKNDWADLARAAAVSGSRTYALKGPLVRLEMAIFALALDRLEREGFTPITVPPFAREQAFVGTGHFPLGREEAYHLTEDKLYLIGTSEVVLNALHADEILEEAQLPILYAGVSGCYRREAGSAGRDVRGLLRVHHFTKVEQFVICRADPEESRRWHDTLLGVSEAILADLELPYQVVACSTGDMGLGKIRMNDVESWVPSLDTYRETHSCSTLHDWQARRTNTRYREAGTRAVRHVHTLNNTAVASPRILAPLLEVHQRADGRVTIPKALRPFMGGAEIL